DTREREQVIDQPRHAARLSFHYFDDPFARYRIVARRALQGIDKAGERGERRAQFVAGVGDEIGAHLLDPPQRREILPADKTEATLEAGRGAGQSDGRDRAREPAVDWYAFKEFHPLRLVGRDGAPDGFDDFRPPQRERGGLATPQRRRHAPGLRVEREDA